MDRISKFSAADVAKLKDSVDWALMPGDHMFDKNPKHYEEVGASAIRVISAALLMANSESPLSILDFACGSGRITRWLRAAFPSASIDVADIRDDGVEFCANRFRANPWKTGPDFSSLVAPNSYDLIWSGSLLTHLTSNDTEVVMEKFHSWLNPSGVCVFTTHGRRAMSNLMTKRLSYVDEAKRSDVIEDFRRDGFSYASYKGTPKLGASFCSVDWLLKRIKLIDARLISISEAAWDQHQDAVSFQRYDQARRYCDWS